MSKNSFNLTNYNMIKSKKIISILFVLIVCFWGTFTIKANAGVFDTVKNAVTGHVDDIKSRFDKDRPSLAYSEENVIKIGTIDEDAIGQDFFHNSKGTVSIVSIDEVNYLVLSQNFDSSPGPDYHVYLSKDPKIIDESGFEQDKQIELGKLQYGNGFQFYKIPAAIDINKINSFLLWCKKFGAYIGSADLKSNL